MQLNLLGERKKEIDKEEKKKLDKYNEYDVMSALQKSIRRGDWKAAGWWAFVMSENNWEFLFWKRMYVIAAEDCERDAILFVDAYKKGYDFITNHGKKKGEGVLMMVRAAIELARMKKDRTADDYVCFFYDLVNNRLWARDKEKAREILGMVFGEDGLPEIPDVAKDGHTLSGKMLGRGFEKNGELNAYGQLFFWDWSATLFNKHPNYDETVRNEYVRYFKELYKKQKGKDWDVVKKVMNKKDNTTDHEELSNKIEKLSDDIYYVKSFTDDNKKYKVEKRNGIFYCECPSYKKGKNPCKHIEAVLFLRYI